MSIPSPPIFISPKVGYLRLLFLSLFRPEVASPLSRLPLPRPALKLSPPSLYLSSSPQLALVQCTSSLYSLCLADTLSFRLLLLPLVHPCYSRRRQIIAYHDQEASSLTNAQEPPCRIARSKVDLFRGFFFEFISLIRATDHPKRTIWFSARLLLSPSLQPP